VLIVGAKDDGWVLAWNRVAHGFLLWAQAWRARVVVGSSEVGASDYPARGLHAGSGVVTAG
jgi:hypothetical protein